MSKQGPYLKFLFHDSFFLITIFTKNVKNIRILNLKVDFLNVLFGETQNSKTFSFKYELKSKIFNFKNLFKIL